MCFLRFIVVSAVVLLVIGMPHSSNGQTIVWTGGTNSNWNVGSNWNTGVVPSFSDSVFIGSAPESPEALTAVTINELTVDTLGALTIGSNFSLSGSGSASLTNNGIIDVGGGGSLEFDTVVTNSSAIIVDGTASTARIRVDGPTHLNGGGNLTFIASTELSGQNDAVLSISNQTLQGAGRIGRGQVAFSFSDDVLVDANESRAVLELQGDDNPGLTGPSGLDGFGTINHGTMRASDGGTLRTIATSIDNTNGVIEALANSMVELGFNSTIVGGTIGSVDNGQIMSVGGDTFLQDVTLDANYIVGNSTSLVTQGAINNQGEIVLLATGSPNTVARINVSSKDAVLSGGGTITLSGDADARIDGMGADASLNILDQTIQGCGRIGIGLAFQLDAETLIDANVMGEQLTIQADNDPGIGGFGVVNNGTMRASLGGILRCRNSIVDNNLGTIEALDGSTVTLVDNTRIVGGLLASQGTGRVAITATTTLEDLHIAADVEVESAAPRLQGAINNSGTISVDSSSDLLIQTLDVTHLQGGGRVVLQGNAQIAGVSGSDKTLKVSDQTIEGTGSVGLFAGFGTVGIAHDFGRSSDRRRQR